MTSNSITPWLQDKGVWMTVLGLILPPLSAKLGIQLSADKIAAMAVMVVSFVLAHKLKSWSILLSELKYKAMSEVSDSPDAVPTPSPVKP